MVTLTKKAAEEFKKVVAAKEFPASTKLRVGVEHSSEQEENLRLYLAFETKPAAATDEAYASEGVEVVVEKQLAELMGDAEIDYVHQPGSQPGFVFSPGKTPAAE